jgi:hypothetical protein
VPQIAPADRFVYAFIITVLRIQVPLFQRKNGLCLLILSMFRPKEKLQKEIREEEEQHWMLTELSVTTEPSCLY